MAESIKVYFEPLGSVGGHTYYYETLVYTNSAGERFLATAYAPDSPSSVSLSGNHPNPIAAAASNVYGVGAASIAATTNGASPYGPLVTQWGPVIALSDRERDHWLGRPDRPFASQTLVVGEDLSRNWAKIVQAYSQAGEQGLPYSRVPRIQIRPRQRASPLGMYRFRLEPASAANIERQHRTSSCPRP